MFEESLEKIYPDKIYEETLKSVLRKKEFPYFFTSKNSVKYIINGLKETNQSPFDFQMLNLKTNFLHSILKNEGYSHKLYNLLIFSDIYYQSFANRLYLINLIPEEITKNKYYYWQTISQSISNSAFNAKEKIIAEKIKTKMADLKNASYVKNIIVKPDIETIAGSISVILISVVFYLAVSAILLILIIKLFF